MYDFADSALIGFCAVALLQTALLLKAKKRLLKLLPAVVCAAGLVLSAAVLVFSIMTLSESAAAENAYVLLLTAAFFGAGLAGCGAAAVCNALMKSRAAVIVPLVAVILAVGAVFAVEWRRGAFEHKWDLYVRVDEITASENGDLCVTASGIWNGTEYDRAYSALTGQIYREDEFYNFVIPAKLAAKYDLFEGMILYCDVKEENGNTTVTKIDSYYKK